MLLLALISFALAHFLINLHTQDFPFSQEWVHCYSPLSGGWGFDAVRCPTRGLQKAAESQSEMSSFSAARTLYGFHSSLVFRKNFHKVVLEEENSQAEPLSRMWPEFGFLKEGPCEPWRAAAGTHLVWQPQAPGQPSDTSLWGLGSSEHPTGALPKTPWVLAPAKICVHEQQLQHLLDSSSG